MKLHVISGYLGAGKTTLVNRLIDAPDAGRLCVIVNDFGALSVDAMVLARAQGLVLPLANGCVCCSAAAGLYKAFETVLNLDPAPARVIIEASGIADPVRVAAVAEAEPDFTPGGIVTLVDPPSLAALLCDPLIASDVIGQLTAADVVLLSRSDLVEARVLDAARRIVDACVPLARIRSAKDVRSHRDLDALLRGAPDRPPRTAATQLAHARYARVTSRGDRLVDSSRLAARLAAFREPSLRVKGIVRDYPDDALLRLDFSNGILTTEPIDMEPSPPGSFITAVFLDRADLRRRLTLLAKEHLTDAPR